MALGGVEDGAVCCCYVGGRGEGAGAMISVNQQRQGQGEFDGCGGWDISSLKQRSTRAVMGGRHTANTHYSNTPSH